MLQICIPVYVVCLARFQCQPGITGAPKYNQTIRNLSVLLTSRSTKSAIGDNRHFLLLVENVNWKRSNVIYLGVDLSLLYSVNRLPY